MSPQLPPFKTAPILIIGGGTWGLSTALHLSRRSYTDITVLDRSHIPSPTSAGNDANKIMEEGKPSPSDTPAQYTWNRMHEISSQYWKTDPVFKGFYHETGIVYSAVGDECYDHVKGWIEGKEDEFEHVQGEAFRKTMPIGVLKGGFPGWRGFWRKDKAGWLFARGALTRVHEELLGHGVKFVTGEEEGNVQTLLYSDSGDIAIGARTKDGVEHKAELTILCAGASADLIFDFEGQLRPTAWTLAHIKLTNSEAALFKDLPVLFNAERGFFIEPTSDTHELKLCDEHPGYVNLLRDDNAFHHDSLHSVPFARHQVPIEAETRMRRFLSDTLGSEIANRPFCFARVCWDADTIDRQFLISRHPRIKELVLAAGGSGMGFMMMPVVGKLVADTLEGSVEERLIEGLKWRPGKGKRDWLDTQGRFGADGGVMQFKDIKGWTDGSGSDIMV